MSLQSRNRMLVRTAGPEGAPVAYADPVASAAEAIANGRVGEQNQKIVYYRLLIDPPAGGLAVTRQNFELFTASRAANPELTNLVEPQRMGPNEAFTIEAIALHPNLGCTEAGLVKLLSDARLRIGIGPDDVERLSAPAAFFPSGNGHISGLVFQDGKAFYRLGRGQEIRLQSGHPFSVRLILGPNAGTLQDAETVDLFVKLLGTYQQGVVR